MISTCKKQPAAVLKTDGYQCSTFKYTTCEFIVQVFFFFSGGYSEGQSWNINWSDPIKHPEFELFTERAHIIRTPKICFYSYESVSKSVRTGRLERQQQMVQLSATKCSCIAISWVSLVNFAAITLCVASQRVFIVVHFSMTQSGNFWIHPRRGLAINPFTVCYYFSRVCPRRRPVCPNIQTQTAITKGLKRTVHFWLKPRNSEGHKAPWKIISHKLKSICMPEVKMWVTTTTELNTEFYKN
jgi:hypothetical protein